MESDFDFKAFVVDNHAVNPVPGLQPVSDGRWVWRKLGNDISVYVTIYPYGVIVHFLCRNYALDYFNREFGGQWVCKHDPVN